MTALFKTLRCVATGTAIVFCTLTATSTMADQVILDDLIVDGSICVGMDCVNGESFGFDTIRLKENNLRIRFQDTSNSASFPSNDWQITINDTSNGGQNKFSIDDIDGGRTPFTIEASAPSNSLYVDDGGRVGFGTGTPIVDMHAVGGNTPTLRLEQDGSSGFTPQTFDIASNESNFFVRDVTNGSQLPFQIKPGADTGSLFIAADGNVGMGTGTPVADLHVRNTSSGVRELFRMTNNGGAFFTMENTATADSWFFLHQDNAPNSLILRHSGDGLQELNLDPDGNMIISGALTENSDRNNKTDIVEVDGSTILDRVGKLPISEWAYKHDTNTRHIGPMAQDFYALFGTGRNDKGISTIDTSGVALASIKALHAENSQLKARLEKLESIVASQQE